ncbi:MAG: DUF4276 family protein [Methyloprofundus sp.]|nr:DUF4276 family protein [Methyloprofundus sp.]MBW6452812.1 DUF4276 family protein [Methyloprofundus sp.]
MSNIIVYIIVEGKTEQTFVRDVLAPYMAVKGVCLSAIRIGVPGHKGGNVKFERAHKDIKRLLQQRSDIYISTMFDYFRIDSDWPGQAAVNTKIKAGTALSVIDKASILETVTLNEMIALLPEDDIAKRFIPYIEMHEFEALLFSDAAILAEKIKGSINQIQSILADYNGPEDINSDPSKAPSKRLEKLMIGYKKVIMGKVISESIGIARIRQQCLHFDCWLQRLEKLTEQNI